jgi:hypothetical protein
MCVICQKSSLREYKSYFERLAGNQVYVLILVNFLAPGSGSAFPIRIQIQINVILVFCIGVTSIIQKIILFQDGVGKRGRFTEPYWRNKGKEFIFLTIKA